MFMAVVAQGELVGKPFNRNFHLRRGDKDVHVRQSRRVRIVAALDEETGDMKFIPAKLALIAVSLLPHTPLVKGTIFDIALQKPSLTTARKRGASTSGVDTDDLVRQRGGDPDYRIPKTRGFAFKSTASEIARERERTKREAEKAIFYNPGP